MDGRIAPVCFWPLLFLCFLLGLLFVGFLAFVLFLASTGFGLRWLQLVLHLLFLLVVVVVDDEV